MHNLMRIALVLLLFALLTLGSTAAHADTLVLSGGYVTEIAGLNIDGTVYNVTFGTTDDMTFATNGEASDAAMDIVAALGTNSIVSSATYNPPYDVQLFCVDTGGGQCQAGYQTPPGTAWTYAGLIGGLNPASPAFGAGAYYAEFAVSTPEPDTISLTLIGIGLFGLLAVIRKRVALWHPQSA